MFARQLKFYSVYANNNLTNPIENAEFIREGFSLYAFIFSGFWAVYNRLWKLLLIILALEFAAGLASETFGVSEVNSTIITIVIGLWVGYEASEFIAKKLESKNYTLIDVVSGTDEFEAKRRFFDRNFRTNEKPSN